MVLRHLNTQSPTINDQYFSFTMRHQATAFNKDLKFYSIQPPHKKEN